MTQIELRSCPFCGDDCSVIGASSPTTSKYIVMCNWCSLVLHGIFPSKEAAIFAWNTRTPSPASPSPVSEGHAEIEQLRGRLAESMRLVSEWYRMADDRYDGEEVTYGTCADELFKVLAATPADTPSPAPPTRSDTREQAAAPPSAVGEELPQPFAFYDKNENRFWEASDNSRDYLSPFPEIVELYTRQQMDALSSQAPNPAEQFHKLDPRDEAIAGLYEKFRVARTDGSSEPGGKHEHCDYFVLDLTHDKHAFGAIHAYATTCRDEYPALANDLLDIAREMAQSGKVPK